MMNYNVSRNSLTVNGYRVDFNYEIKSFLDVDNLIIIMIWDVSIGDIQKQPLNNVYAVDKNGNIVWNLKDIVGKDGLYTAIRVNKSNNLVAAEFIGMNYIIDVKTKQIIGGRAYK